MEILIYFAGNSSSFNSCIETALYNSNHLSSCSCLWHADSKGHVCSNVFKTCLFSKDNMYSDNFFSKKQPQQQQQQQHNNNNNNSNNNNNNNNNKNYMKNVLH